MTDPLALRRLREHAARVLELTDAPEWLPYRHLVLDLLDPRPRTEKIAECVRRAALTLPPGLDDRQRTGATLRILERDLPRLPLAEVPCDKTVREMIRNFPPKFHIAAVSGATLAASTST